LRNTITKEIVKLDKTLREEIEILEVEKAHLDQALSKEKTKLIASFETDLTALIKSTTKTQQELFQLAESEARVAYQNRLKQIKEQFDTQKVAWTKHIFDAVTKGTSE
jgi:ribosome-binding ATPase YchF (GTP1/OBG family)